MPSRHNRSPVVTVLRAIRIRRTRCGRGLPRAAGRRPPSDLGGEPLSAPAGPPWRFDSVLWGRDGTQSSNPRQRRHRPLLRRGGAGGGRHGRNGRIVRGRGGGRRSRSGRSRDVVSPCRGSPAAQTRMRSGQHLRDLLQRRQGLAAGRGLPSRRDRALGVHGGPLRLVREQCWLRGGRGGATGGMQAPQPGWPGRRRRPGFVSRLRVRAIADRPLRPMFAQNISVIVGIGPVKMPSRASRSSSLASSRPWRARSRAVAKPA